MIATAEPNPAHSVLLHAFVCPSWWPLAAYKAEHADRQVARRQLAYQVVKQLVRGATVGPQTNSDHGIDILADVETTDQATAFFALVEQARAAAESTPPTDAELVADLLHANSRLQARVDARDRQIVALKARTGPDHLYGIYLRSFQHAASGVCVAAEAGPLEEQVAAALGAEHAKGGGAEGNVVDPLDASDSVDYRPFLAPQSEVLTEIRRLLNRPEVGDPASWSDAAQAERLAMQGNLDAP